jgi:NAD(P)-dependent dehydrogenase (short-subunit alcohol dehydrogenase family)
MNLSGKACIVTGGSRGLGRGVVVALAKAGANVLVVDIDGEPVVESGLPEGRLRHLNADVTRDEDRTRIVETCTSAFGRIDMLVNNAGIGQQTIRADYATNPLHPWDVPAQNLAEFFAVHSIAPLRLAAEVIPTMRAQGRGRILTVVTDFAVMMRPSFTAYGGAKAASEAYTAGLAVDLKDSGVTVNAITPGGMVDTRLVPDRPGMKRQDLLQPGVMGPAVVWFASDEADGITAKRIDAKLWDQTLPGKQNAERVCKPIGWGPLGV